MTLHLNSMGNVGIDGNGEFYTPDPSYPMGYDLYESEEEIHEDPLQHNPVNSWVEGD